MLFLWKTHQLSSLLENYILKLSFILQDIIVRVCFILGNMTAKNDEARVQLFQETKSLDIILTVFKTYVEMDYKVINVFFYLDLWCMRDIRL